MNVRVDMYLDDVKAHARAVRAELLALEGVVGVEVCRPLHAAMWAAIKRLAEHHGTTAGALLDDPSIDSGGTKEPEA